MVPQVARAIAPWYVYLLGCADGSIYTGIARDPHERLEAHGRGVGAAYTRSRLPVSLEYVEPAANRGSALRRELEIKALPRNRKLELIATREQVSNAAPLLTAPALGVPHGFATRAGGVSEGEFASLNLGAVTGDDSRAVEENRRRFASWFGVDQAHVCLLEQVHGTRVVAARHSEAEVLPADAHVSDDPELLLVIASADCLPLLFYDQDSGVVGAAHCGWRGTIMSLAQLTVAAMTERFGTRPEDVRVAIGPGICGRCYQVGEDVAGPATAAGLPAKVLAGDEEGRWRLDLREANRHLLEQAGVPAESIHVVDACTSCSSELFFSHRRDKGRTGRHWAGIRAARRR